MRRWVTFGFLFVGCASKGSGPAQVAAPTEAVAPQPIRSSPPSDERAAPVEPEAAEAIRQPAPVDPDPDPPDFEPIRLNEDQLRRAKAVQPFVAKAAADHGIDPNLLNGIIWAESKFNPKARNKKSGARGLMQLMPGTAKAMAKRLGRPSRPYDPEFATQAGAKLLSILSDKFEADEQLMLFGYARGSGSVRKWQKTDAPIPEGVQKFIARVRRARATFESLGFPDSGGQSPHVWSAGDDGGNIGWCISAVGSCSSPCVVCSPSRPAVATVGTGTMATSAMATVTRRTTPTARTRPDGTQCGRSSSGTC